MLPIGYEQEFTVMQRPSGSGALTLAMATNEEAYKEQQWCHLGEAALQRFGRDQCWWQDHSRNSEEPGRSHLDCS